ncbi:hypothetical protein [Flavimaricola marinus]|uniref:Uncharacterized protein n=1 Tax=Flavimaricola marinus TaxID=1819565 RepID=A0A238LLV1_9RHOB|nr:hypothetical protein [Flavimaricola marinus]SMY10364.1 hypothetical protein LOM8899_04539 [Flavimaricola marinus]
MSKTTNKYSTELRERAARMVIKGAILYFDIHFEPAMLLVSQIGSSTGEDRHSTLGVDASRIERWREGGLSKAEQALCEKVAKSEMAVWGYEPSGQRNSVLRHSLFMLGFALKTGLAVLLNARRSKNMLQSIRRRLS